MAIESSINPGVNALSWGPGMVRDLDFNHGSAFLINPRFHVDAAPIWNALHIAIFFTGRLAPFRF